VVCWNSHARFELGTVSAFRRAGEKMGARVLPRARGADSSYGLMATYSIGWPAAFLAGESRIAHAGSVCASNTSSVYLYVHVNSSVLSY
jgi:hypothetical protein